MLKKIRVEDLGLGMHIKAFCGSWMEHPFWRENFLLADDEDLRRILQSSIREVWIDAAKGLDVKPEVAAETVEHAEAAVDEALRGVAQDAAGARPAPRRASRADELQRAARICAQSQQAVVSMFQEVRMGRAVDIKAATAVAEEISSSVARHPGALISLARLKSADDYTYMHSVAVCALMTALAHQLGLGVTETREAAMAGLLHDLGKAVTPPEILNKTGKLTDEEFAVMKRHPADGHRLLSDGGAVGGIPLDVCLHHHEKVDGSGYPDRLAGERISLFAKMGAVCDVYDAITSNRPYKSGWDPAESIGRMAEWSKGHFDERIFQAFVKSIGIYPVGTLVRLESGRLGVVIEQASKSLLAPLVKVFFSTKSLTYIVPEVVDLSRKGVRDKIAGREDAAKWGINNFDSYWAAP